MSNLEALKLLRAPFPEHQISKLNRGKGVVFDYVGHAALTSRLLDVDPQWYWEPMGITAAGLPAFDDQGGLWIRLTVCGMTRLGYGNAPKKGTPGDREKECIGDALRNAAMRFGAALDLWHKGDLNKEELESQPEPDPAALKLRAQEILQLVGRAETKEQLDAAMNEAREEYEDLKTVKGFVESIKAMREGAEIRLGIKKGEGK